MRKKQLKKLKEIICEDCSLNCAEDVICGSIERIEKILT